MLQDECTTHLNSDDLQYFQDNKNRYFRLTKQGRLNRIAIRGDCVVLLPERGGLPARDKDTDCAQEIAIAYGAAADVYLRGYRRWLRLGI